MSLINNIKYCKTVILLFLSVFLFTSCNEEIIETPDDISSNSDLRVIKYGRSNAGKNASNSSGKNSFSGTNIIIFSSEEAFDYHIKNLEIQTENWDDNFLAQWGHLNDDDLNSKEEELNYDSEKPLTDFENELGFESLRQKYLLEEEAWLNNEILDPLTDPDGKSIYDFDSNEMVVYNKLSEVQIGTTIYKSLNEEEIALINNEMRSRGNSKTLESDDNPTLVIADSDYDVLVDFNNGDVSVINNDNVSVVNSNTSSGCSDHKTIREFIATAEGKKIKAIIKVMRPLTLRKSGKMKTKIKSYKKRGSRWKKWRTKIATGMDGVVHDGSCSNPPNIIDGQWSSERRRKKRKFIWDNDYFDAHVVENGGLTGLYRQNGFEVELPLTW